MFCVLGSVFPHNTKHAVVFVVHRLEFCESPQHSPIKETHSNLDLLLLNEQCKQCPFTPKVVNQPRYVSSVCVCVWGGIKQVQPSKA